MGMQASSSSIDVSHSEVKQMREVGSGDVWQSNKAADEQELNGSAESASKTDRWTATITRK